MLAAKFGSDLPVAHTAGEGRIVGGGVVRVGIAECVSTTQGRIVSRTVQRCQIVLPVVQTPSSPTPTTTGADCCSVSTSAAECR